MASTPSLSSSSALSETQRTQFMEAITESLAISAGRGSSQYVTETILTKHDRFGNAPIQINSEMVGLTFFTKPRLNMTTTSLRQDRMLALLESMDPRSLMFSLRCNLDTVFQQSSMVAPIAAASPWVNVESPFNIPLGNTLIGMSGWPDFNLESETTEAGYFSEDMTMARGSDRGRRTVDISCTFRDIQGGYIMAYFYYWLHAMALQMEGTIVAYPDDREYNRLNYTCSIYRFIMDPSMRTIVKWAKATGCYPQSIPIGDMFNFSPGDSFVHTSQQFTVPFKVNHVAYMDPSDLQAFNEVVRRYAGRDLGTSSSRRKKVPVAAPSNFKGVPFIDLYSGTNELSYWALPEELLVPSDDIIKQISAALDSTTNTLGDKWTTQTPDS